MGSSFELSGRIALVTGASSGLGRHFARVLADAGATVVAAARRLDALQDLCASIGEAGGKAIPIELDVTDADSIRAALTQADAGRGLDIVVNSAGVTATKPVLDVSEAEWDLIVDTNLKGTFLVAQEAARLMKQRGRGGTIVNIGSILGIRVAQQLPAYIASKAAVSHLTKALALELARHKIRVNALCPGYIETDLNADFFDTEPGQALIRRIPQRRLGQAADLDGPLLLLCSDAGSYITGAEVVVDGGHLVSSL